MRLLALILPFVLTACLKDETVSGYVPEGAVFRLVELNGRPFTAQATLSFPGPGQVAGQGPCNGFRGVQSVPYPWIQIDGIAATKRACPDLTAEAAYFAALRAATLVEAVGNTLILSNDSGVVAVFQTASE